MHIQSTSRISLCLPRTPQVPHFFKSQFEFVKQICEKLFRLSLCKCFFIERIQILIQTSDWVMISVILYHNSAMSYEHKLQNLLECLRRILRDNSAVCRHSQKLRLSLFILTLGSHFFSQISISVSKVDNSFHYNYHGLPGILPVHLFKGHFFLFKRFKFLLAFIDIITITHFDHFRIIRIHAHGRLLGYSLGHDPHFYGLQLFFCILDSRQVLKSLTLPFFQDGSKFFFFFR